MAFTKQRWVVIGGVAAVAILLLFSEHSKQTTSGSSGTSPTGASGSCMVRITADVLNARSSPDGNAEIVDTYRKDEVVSADRITQNGFRQLRPGIWVAQAFAQPTPGSDCG